jgi:general secretion pathway protein D
MKLFLSSFLMMAFFVGPASSAQQPNGQITPFGVIPATQPPPAPAPAPVPAQAPVAQAPPPAAPAAAPAPQPQAPPASQATDDVVPISLDLDNTDIYQVIKILAETLKLNYIIDPTIKGTVNIHTSGNLKRSDLLPLLETLLKMNGATMVKIGSFYHIVPVTTALRQPLQVQGANAVSGDDQIVIQVVRMKFVSAAEMARLLTPYLGEGANILTHDSDNILLLSERRSNLRKLLELIDVFDSKAFQGDRVRLFPVKSSVVRDLVSDLKLVFAGYGFGENGSAMRFVALERMNAVLAITTNQELFSQVEQWIERLDQPLPSAGLRNYVYKMKNTKATDIQTVLLNLYAPQAQRPATPGAPGQPAPQQPPFQPSTTPFSLPSQTPDVISAAVGNNGIKIISDVVNNFLIIQATPQDWIQIERTLEQLDVLPRQVLIDAQIYEVTLDESLNIGLSATLQNRGTLANPQTTASFAGSPPGLAIQTFGFVGRTRELVAFLNSAENRSRVRTVSAPSVLVKDNMVADFTVGADIPVPTSSAIAGGVQSNGSSVFTQTISFRSVGVLLRVRPQINDSGTLTLEVSQEVSQASANTTSSIAAPEIGRSAVNSTIVVENNQTIAIGGFIRENKDVSRSRLPLLGRIPGIGVMFGNTDTSSSRTELVVLITPHVVRTRDELESASDELKGRLREVQKLIK